MRKYMDQEKRCDAHQADGITQKPPYRRRLIFTPGNAVIGDQACDADDGCSCRRARSHENVADHIPAVTQLNIDPEVPAQHVGCHAIAEGASHAANCATEGHEWL